MCGIEGREGAQGPSVLRGMATQDFGLLKRAWVPAPGLPVAETLGFHSFTTAIKSCPSLGTDKLP